MTLAKPTDTNSFDSFGISTTETVQQPPFALDTRLVDLATQVSNSVLSLWAQWQPTTTHKTHAVWQLLRHTQPVQLLLTAALAVLAIALITLITTFNGLLILFLKLAALTLATVAVGQWIVRGLHWADEKLPATDGNE